MKSCRDHYWEFCHCYDYVCPGPKGDSRGCGFPYKEDEDSCHWFHQKPNGMSCTNCGEMMPDIGCQPKIAQTNSQSQQTQQAQQQLFNAN
jgi:hypothetical protein